MASVSCGIDFFHCEEITSKINVMSEAGCNFSCVPLVHPLNRREFFGKPGSNRKGPLTRSDLLLSGKDWSTLIVGKISPWLDLESPFEKIRLNSEKALTQELMLASHLCLAACEISLKSSCSTNLARCLLDHATNSTSMSFWIRVPMRSAKYRLDDIVEGESTDDNDSDDTWSWWHKLHLLLGSHRRVGVALELSADLLPQEELSRWCAEPVKACYIPTTVFVTNTKGFPVLQPMHRKFVQSLFRLGAQPVLTGTSLYADGFLKYRQYLNHIFTKQDPLDTYNTFSQGYEDLLQSPLQPLMDNLESQMYETFEQDPVKYELYEEAITQALQDKLKAEGDQPIEIVLMVVGAGRGPLVNASLRAAEKAQAKLKVYAVEKNPNAVITLENLKADQWGDRVTVVSCDMREWEAPDKADILVSELLGSFGDNELSPECLYGVEMVLKDGGISIPSSYSSFLAPIMSAKLYNEAAGMRELDKHPLVHFETPYVVRHHNCMLLGDPKEVFTFDHPKPKQCLTDERYCTLDFTAKVDAVVHGFAGYFEATLYKDVLLSIHPDTHSPNMFSWFPIYFPISEPMQVSTGEQIVCNIWRKTSKKKVWYEWCYTAPAVTPIHNPSGRSYTIGL